LPRSASGCQSTVRVLQAIKERRRRSRAGR
jgi:hypothetical protein